MNKKRQIPEVETLFEESQFFYAVLNNESDLACVLIASSFLDNALAGLLKNYFIDSSLVNKLLDSPLRVESLTRSLPLPVPYHLPATPVPQTKL